MPPLMPIPTLPVLNITTVVDVALAPSSNSTAKALQVICAWPVSGQYGPGTRILYYALIATCLLARKADWLVNACLAAALLLPAVAALHGIALTALHVHDAVDMDIFGAFQLCAIGILAAPVTVMMSRTYFNDPGRNTIFLWVFLILVGMLCLAIEFYRIETFDCTSADSSTPMSIDISNFPLGNDTICGLPFHCTTTPDGPTSPMRGGAADNVYIIPAPDTLTLGTATLLAAACCVHAVLCLISMWDKILEINWRRRSRANKDGDHTPELSDGDEDGRSQSSDTSQASDSSDAKRNKSIDERIQYFLKIIAVPIFGGVGLAILILGEINFYSRQVRYQTEPLASVGQWAPICGTFLAMVGSLYVLVAKKIQAAKEGLDTIPPPCSCRHTGCCKGCCKGQLQHHLPSTQDTQSSRQGHFEPILSGPGSDPPAPHDPSTGDSHEKGKDAGYRRKVARALISFGEWLGTPRDHDDSDFQHGPAKGYPIVPGEHSRNSKLPDIIERQTRRSEVERARASSAAGSFTVSDTSCLENYHDSRSHRGVSPASWSSNRRHNEELERGRDMTDIELSVQRVQSDPAVASPVGYSRQRRNTLEVPSPCYHGYGRGRGRTASPSPSSTGTIV